MGSLSAGDNQSASSRFQADTSVLGNDVRSVSVARPGDHSPGTALARGQQRQRSSSVDYGRVRLEGVVSPSTTPSISDSKTCLFGVPASLSQGYSRDRIPWLKYSSQPPVAPPLSWSDAQAIQNFFAKYTLVPYDFPTTNAGKDKTGEGCVSQRASQGFLEFLPCTFEEVNVTGRYALRWAVQAAALADVATQDPFSRKQDDTVYASGTQSGAGTGQRALECYGLALSALSDSLGKDGKTPDDYDLMAVVILDIFEVSESIHNLGSHVLIDADNLMCRHCSYQTMFPKVVMPKACPRYFERGDLNNFTTPEDGVSSGLLTTGSKSSHWPPASPRLRWSMNCWTISTIR